jgi:hypothetical protein
MVLYSCLYFKNAAQNELLGNLVHTNNNGLLMQEQLTPDLNPLFMLIHDAVRYNASAVHEMGSFPRTGQYVTGCDTRHITNTVNPLLITNCRNIMSIIALLT